MKRPKVLLVIDDGALRARYEMVLRLCGYDPVTVDGGSGLNEARHGIIAGCVLTGHGPAVEALSSKLLARAVPIVRIDPYIRHARHHLPFDVVLPATSEPRDLIAALRHLMPGGAHPS